MNANIANEDQGSVAGINATMADSSPILAQRSVHRYQGGVRRPSAIGAAFAAVVREMSDGICLRRLLEADLVSASRVP